MADVIWEEVGAEEAAQVSNIIRFLGKGADGQAAEFSINANVDLRKRLSVAKVGEIYRVIYTGDKDTGKEHPTKMFKVDLGRVGAATPKPAADASLFGL